MGRKKISKCSSALRRKAIHRAFYRYQSSKTGFKGDDMKFGLFAAVALSVALPLSAAGAQPGPQPFYGQVRPVPPQVKPAVVPAQPKKHHAPQVQAPRPPAPRAHVQAPRHPAPPRIGQRAHNAREFTRQQRSRFKAPPRGQEYRVMNDHLVLVDQRSLQVMSVVGLLSTLLK